jgi:hypothetical protein
MGAGDVPRPYAERLLLVRQSARGMDCCRLCWQPKPGGHRCPWQPLPVQLVTARQLACPLGHCAAMACELPIRPVLKHGPRSLTCVQVDGFLNLGCVRKLTSGRPLCAAPLADPDLM